jgi:Methyltransferase domain
MLDFRAVSSLDDIPGWFNWTDQQLFRFLLGPGAPAESGDIVELGVYLGKSAVLLGEYLRPDERLVVCDLFNSRSDAVNDEVNARRYPRLSREAFEHNYRSLRGSLPEIVQAPSSVITQHLHPHTVRFLHVDASHLYDHVMVDVESAVTLLTRTGIVAFDDWRNFNWPGVAAAVWGAVRDGRLFPVCLTQKKLYAVVADPDHAREVLVAWLTDFGRLEWEAQDIAGLPVVRILPPRPATAARSPDLGVDETLKRILQRLWRIEDQLVEHDNAHVTALSRRALRAGRRKLARLRGASASN